MLKFSLLCLLLLSGISAIYAQRGKNGALTVSGSTTIINAYTTLASDVSAGSNTISVASAALSINIVPANASLAATLSAGDLILIYQAQGAAMDVNLTTTVDWGGNYTLSQNGFADFSNMNNYRHEWGAVTNYNNAGKYEYAEVLSVAGNTITTDCGLKNSYVTSGHTQIIRIPRFTNLTLAANAVLAPPLWDGAKGGIIAIEVDGVLSFGTNSKISASGTGFRGGVVENASGGPASSPSDFGKPGYSAASEGAEKGEGIGGSAAAEYTTVYYSRYGCGAPANGGGGGNYKNAGGGGGANIGSGTYTGKGVPGAGYAAFWNLEQAGLATSPSSGGGRGGYSGAQTDQNEAVVGPNNAAWTADYRRKEGGLGGHPLAYDASRVFMGGGGGAGEMDQSQGGNGGAGGGIVFIQSYGTITGTGLIEANGANGQNSNPAGTAPSASPASNQKKGIDGAGGAGGGGSVIISNGAAIPATITLAANGGNGGNNNVSFYSVFTSPNEADGPGGGGAGGFINYTSGTPVTSLTGGISGIVTTATYPSTNLVANFPPNGATGGSAGSSMITQPFFDLNVANATICAGNTATLTATVLGTLPAGSQVNWYSSYSASSPVAGGSNTLSFTTPVLSSTTTYYVGICGSGTFRKPVTVTVGGPLISGTAVITDVTCTTPGSVTGLTTSGGVAPVVIKWNGVTTAGMDLTNASAGIYNVVVTDDAGCTATSGPYTINSAGGPTVNTTAMIVTNESCNGNDGSVTGITTTGNVVSVSWNSGAYTTLDITNLPDGNYSLLVTDNLGCTASAGPITINPTSGPVINTAGSVISNETCSNNNGSITGIVATGTGLTFEWNSVAAADEDITGLTAGTYTLVAEDNNGCTASAGPFTIIDELSPVISAAGITISPEHCGQQDGSISGLTVSGGEIPYAYSWSPGAYTTLDIAALSAGNYSLTVTDNNGCTAASGPHVVTNTAAPVINTTNMVITPESCAGNDGSITGITVSGTGLDYVWNLNPATSADLGNAPGGTYYLGAEDQFGCNTIGGPYVIPGATPLSLNTTNVVVTNTACSSNTGSITGIQIVGGINPTVQWSNTASVLDINNLGTGTYNITVTDDQGCSATASFTVGMQNAPVISTLNVVVVGEHCNQDDGSVSGISVTGGTPAYTYLWDNISTQNTLDIAGLSSGNHVIVVTDAQGCSANALVNIPALGGPSIDASGAVVVNTTCNENTGSINGISYNGTNPLTYSWTNSAQTTAGLVNALPGNYAVTVTDAFGCTATSQTLTIGSSPLPDADFSFSPENPNPGDNVIFTDATTGAGIAFYEWTINNTSVSDDPSFSHTFSEEGIYEIELFVVSADGCIDSIAKTIELLGEVSIPNIVSLGSQSNNNVFLIKNLKPKSELIIFNRWGNAVFKTKDYKNDWKGLDLNGELCNDGVYTYQLINPQGILYQGFVHLLNK